MNQNINQIKIYVERLFTVCMTNRCVVLTHVEGNLYLEGKQKNARTFFAPALRSPKVDKFHKTIIGLAKE